jgi:hypothetical protein
MQRRLILGLPGSRETRKQFPNYREHIIPLVLAAADDALNEHLQYCLRYITYQRHHVTSGRISYLLLRYNGYGRAEVDLVVEDQVTTRVEVDAFPVGSVVPSTPEEQDEWQNLVFQIVDLWLSKLPVTANTPDETLNRPAQRDAGPTLRTRERFAIFKQLKDAHPTWSQDRVAREASAELGEVVFAETVRNTYRLMGEKWPRGDRVR